MVDFVEAIKTPFNNVKILIAPFAIYFVILILGAISGGFLDIANLVSIFLPEVGILLAGLAVVVAAVLGLVILVLTLTVNGYLFGTMQNILDKREIVKFQFSGILGYILRAIKGGIISFIYAIPGLVMLAIAAVIIFGGAIIGMLTGGNTQALVETAMASIFTAGLFAIPFVLLAILFLVIAGYLLPAAISIWLKEDRMLAAFSFGRILKNVFKLDYLLSLIVTFLVNMLFGIIVFFVVGIIVFIVSLILPSVGSAISAFFSNLVSFIVAMILYAMLAQTIQ